MVIWIWTWTSAHSPTRFRYPDEPAASQSRPTFKEHSNFCSDRAFVLFDQAQACEAGHCETRSLPHGDELDKAGLAMPADAGFSGAGRLDWCRPKDKDAASQSERELLGLRNSVLSCP